MAISSPDYDEKDFIAVGGADESMVSTTTRLHPARKKRRNRCVCISVAISTIVVVVAFSACLALFVNKKSGSTKKEEAAPSAMAFCAATTFKDECSQALNGSSAYNSSIPDWVSKLDPAVRYPVMLVLDSAGSLTNLVQIVDDFVAKYNRTSDGTVSLLLEAAVSCNESLHDSAQMLNETARLLAAGDVDEAMATLSSVRTWNTDCADDLYEVLYNISGGGVRGVVDNLTLSVNVTAAEAVKYAEYAAMQLSNALDVGGNVPSQEGQGWFEVLNRQLLARRALADTAAAIETKPDATVSRDGAGNFGSVQEAINQAPSMRKSKRYVIHVTSGVYKEKITVPRDKWLITLVGDGDATVLTYDSYAKRAGGTARSASVTVLGRGFIATKLKIMNTAEPQEVVQQAVALRISGGMGVAMAAVVDCTIVANQDTLYAHNGWQYYRHVRIYGTVDYIFGNAAAVFEDCELISKRQSGKDNTITAQGRTSKGEKTGFVFRHCKVDVEKDNLVPVSLGRPQPYRRVYFGRPWHPYALVVFMNCYIGNVQPEGWMPWYKGNKATNTEDCSFYEYSNTGPGADTSKRVSWSKKLAPAEAAKYTAERFIEAPTWLPRLGVSYRTD
ncbi:hypothetical protein CBR_g8861 [Chara braunii]|uniref:Pectinesterase n=1 Tax=Chara braunii TaxID=69332 RepID=A0A388KN14_CHABU|nr:hypothetical protein CBR_g8861 [Chara braunii]|eukprot:GBG71442.1 hypothetical protein CBR_g8861 [Chara braunii]